MDVSGVLKTDNSTLLSDALNKAKVTTDNTQAFDSLLQSAISMYKEADALQKSAEESEMNFALGYSNSTHDLAVAQQKANISLQYVTKVTNKALEAYKEIMNLSF